MADPTRARGYRNCNPGNIRYVPANKFQGLASPPADDGGMCRFVSHQYGIRAICVVLITYQDRHNLWSIRDIIQRWAPPNENDTEAYIRAVSQSTGYAADRALDLHTYADLRPLVAAIIRHELGGQPYDAATIDRGLAMAGVAAPAEIRTLAATGTAQAAVGTAAVGVGTIGALQVLQVVLPHVAGLAEAVRTLGPWATGAALLVAAGVYLWRRWREQKAIAS